MTKKENKKIENIGKNDASGWDRQHQGLSSCMYFTYL